MGGGVVERTLVCLWVDWMGIEGGGAVAVMDRWRISIFDLERNVVISYQLFSAGAAREDGRR